MNNKYKNNKNTAVNLSIGFLIGASNTMPGISGGSIALLMGVYHKLMASLAVLSPRMMFSLLHPKTRSSVLAKANLPFLLPLILGAVLGIFVFSSFVPQLLQRYPQQMNALFLGLVLASVPNVIHLLHNRITLFNVSVIVFFAIASYHFTHITMQALTNSAWLHFASGLVASIAMFLPGISGSFVLLVFGNYSFILKNVNQVFLLNIDAAITLIPFGLGIICGTILFVTTINFLFKKCFAATIAGLLGLLFGSLTVLWPFANEVNEKIFWPNKFSQEHFYTIVIFCSSVLFTYCFVGRSKKIHDS